MFEIFHFLVLLASGIFFYKWIFINILFLILLRSKSIENTFRVYRSSLLFCSLIIIPLAPFIFYIPPLGWYDSNVIPDQKFFLVDNEQHQIEINTSFLREFSVVAAQTRFVSSRLKEFGAYGATDQADKILNDCNQLQASYTEFIPKENIQESIYRFWYSLEDVYSSRPYYPDLFPHHIWSDFGFQSFSAEEISGFKELIIESRVYCLGEDYSPNLVKQISEKYDLRRAEK